MPLQTLPCRAFQRGFALGARLLPWRTPTVLSGAGSLLKLPDVFSREGASRPLVVASRRQCADERFLALRAALEGRGVRPSVFSGVEPDPSVATVEKLAAQYRADGCDSFLVLGGGSPIDAAKVAAARGIRGEDLPRMAAWAAAEANPVYPVPVVYAQARFRRVLERLRA